MDHIIRSFGSREQANSWAYNNGRADQRLFVITENVQAPFTYWVLCEAVFQTVKLLPNAFQILSVYE